jgi:hypothetical protein
MIKTQIENILGLKALAWDYERRQFISPARPDFVWSPGGLQASVCANGYKHSVPDRNCTCGLYASYDIHIIDEYTGTSPVSPIFLVEPSGHTIIHEYGFRSAEMTIQMVAVPGDRKQGTLYLAAQQAADYFQIDVVPMEQMLIMMDIFNTFQMSYYYARSSQLRGVSRENILKVAKEFYAKQHAE